MNNNFTNKEVQATAFEMLLDAVGRSLSPVIQQLLSSDPYLVQLKGWHGVTALHKACLIGDYNIVLILIQANSDVNATTDYLETSLHYACKRGIPSIVHLLVQCGARLDLKDKVGRSALHHAAEAGSVQVVKYLEEACEINVAEQDIKLQSLLHIACTYGHYDLFHFLLKNRRCDPLQMDIEGNLPIHLTCKHGFGYMTWTLLSLLGVSVLNLRNLSGYTPVDLALQGDNYGHKEIVPILTHYRNHPEITAVSGPVITWYNLLFFPFVVFSLATLVTHSIYGYQFLVYLAAFVFAVVKMHGMTHRIKHICRWPNPFYLGIFAAGIIHTTFCYFWVILPNIYTRWWVIILSVTFCPLLHILFWSLLRKDPGCVERSCHDETNGKILTVLDLCMLRNPPYNYCSTCDLVTNNLTKHCKLCDKCFLHLDHHCLFLLKCVASKNHVHFVWLIILSIVNMVSYLMGFLMYMRLHLFHLPWSDIFWQLLHHHAWPMSLALLNSWSAIWCTCLLHTQYTHVTRGCTTYFHYSEPQPVPLTHFQAFVNFVHFLFKMPMPYKSQFSKIDHSQLIQVST